MLCTHLRVDEATAHARHPRRVEARENGFHLSFQAGALVGERLDGRALALHRHLAASAGGGSRQDRAASCYAERRRAQRRASPAADDRARPTNSPALLRHARLLSQKLQLPRRMAQLQGDGDAADGAAPLWTADDRAYMRLALAEARALRCLPWSAPLSRAAGEARLGPLGSARRVRACGKRRSRLALALTRRPGTAASSCVTASWLQLAATAPT